MFEAVCEAWNFQVMQIIVGKWRLKISTDCHRDTRPLHTKSEVPWNAFINFRLSCYQGRKSSRSFAYPSWCLRSAGSACSSGCKLLFVKWVFTWFPAHVALDYAAVHMLWAQPFLLLAACLDWLSQLLKLHPELRWQRLNLQVPQFVLHEWVPAEEAVALGPIVVAFALSTC